MKTILCPDCGARIPPEAAFCTQCGAKRSGRAENTLCPDCGARIPPEAAFCTQCGAKRGRLAKAKRKTSADGAAADKWGRAAKWLLVGALLALLVGVGAFLLLRNTEANQFERAVEKREISQAMRIYDEMALSDRAEANAWLREHIKSIEAEYYNESYDYTTAKNMLEDVRRFASVQGAAADALERIAADNEATIAYLQAQRYAEQGLWQQAYTALEGLSIDYRSYDEAAALRSECAENYKRAVLASCAELEAAGDYPAIFESLGAALQVLPDDTELSVKFREYAVRFEPAALAAAAELADAGDYEGAIELLAEALENYRYDSFFAAIEEYSFLRLKADCEEIYRNSGTESVIAHLSSLGVPNDSGDYRLPILEEYRQKYVEEVLGEAAAKAGAQDFEGAIRLLQSARSVYDAVEFQTAIADYEGYLPIDLAQCRLLEESDGFQKYIGVDGTDNFGNKYKNAICWQGYGQREKYAVFYLDRRYATLSGTIAPLDCKGKTAGYICIYLDGDEVYRREAITATTEPFSFEINVSGRSQLRLEICCTDGGIIDGWGVVIAARLS